MSRDLDVARILRYKPILVYARDGNSVVDSRTAKPEQQGADDQEVRGKEADGGVNKNL